MDRTVRDEWVAALRSGEYEQAQGVLCDMDGAMCCLGVLIDVTQDGDWVEGKNPYSGTPTWTYTAQPLMLGRVTAKELDLDWCDAVSLARMNDRHKSFAEIADWIEANV